jgi:phage-related protein
MSPRFVFKGCASERHLDLNPFDKSERLGRGGGRTRRVIAILQRLVGCKKTIKMQATGPPLQSEFSNLM